MNRCLIGDCRESMRQIIDVGVRVQMCVTSPPYFGLRDYGVDGQLGLEDSPDQYIANMVEVFRLVRDLLADDGTLWLNMGDSYAASRRGGGGGSLNDGDVGTKVSSANSRRSPVRGSVLPAGMHESVLGSGGIERAWVKPPAGFKQKDLLGMPWRLAFALQADGWYLRQDIIWHKPNPMPESVTDRCTKAHEYLFLLSKSERYYWNQEAMREPATDTGRKNGREGRDENAAARPPGSSPRKLARIDYSELGRNRRSVWTIPVSKFSGAHFATFPTALVEPCILAGSRPGDTVLDPFFGSGTTGQVAASLGRDWIGCELNAAYAELQAQRTAQDGLTF